ncbi:MAG: hypothetical protein ACI965_001792 [Paraglaciecola sp.]|jgi:hypothetical protein
MFSENNYLSTMLLLALIGVRILLFSQAGGF